VLPHELALALKFALGGLSLEAGLRFGGDFLLPGLVC